MAEIPTVPTTEKLIAQVKKLPNLTLESDGVEEFIKRATENPASPDLQSELEILQRWSKARNKSQ